MVLLLIFINEKFRLRFTPYVPRFAPIQLNLLQKLTPICAFSISPLPFHQPTLSDAAAPLCSGATVSLLYCSRTCCRPVTLTPPSLIIVLYNDIAKFGYVALGRSKFTGEKDSSQSNSPTLQNASHVKRPAGLGGL
ncbi:uncharacterized protein [Arachis hypogaea]|uniref:uncharacterized protein n=1 Tax=Arachis hypogaea TaxID=3818 RepID=UPI003B2177D3